MCYYRADLFERFRGPAPELGRVSRAGGLLPRSQEPGGRGAAAEAAWSGTVEPLATSWAAACCWPARRRMPDISTIIRRCFKSPAWSRSLTDRRSSRAGRAVADAKFGPSGAAGSSRRGAKVPGRPGRHGVRFPGMPRASRRVEPGEAGDRLRRAARFAEGVQHRRRGGTSDADASQRVTLSGVAGRLGSIAESSHPDRPSNCWPGCRARSGARRGIGQPGDDLLSPLPGSRSAPLGRPLTDSQAAAEFATAVRDALSEQAALPSAHPGPGPLHGALDEAVAAALAGTRRPRPPCKKPPPAGNRSPPSWASTPSASVSQQPGPGAVVVGATGREDQAQRLMAVQSFILGESRPFPCTRTRSRNRGRLGILCPSCHVCASGQCWRA